MTADSAALTDAECDAIADGIFERSAGYVVSVPQRTRQRALVRAGFAAGLARVRGEWREAVIDELVIAHIYSKKHDADPRKAIRDAITWNCQVALDPLVSSDARLLIERGRAQGVPREPTQEMYEACATIIGKRGAKLAWQLMYDAAPARAAAPAQEAPEQWAARFATILAATPSDNDAPAPAPGAEDGPVPLSEWQQLVRQTERDAERIAELERERNTLQLVVKDDAQWAQENERLTRERDEVRAMLQNTNRDAARLARIADDYKENSAHFLARSERAESRADRLATALRELVGVLEVGAVMPETIGKFMWLRMDGQELTAARAALAGEADNG